MKITASIVTFRTPAAELRGCLDSLAEAERVWVVDNSADAATEAVCRDYSGAEYVASDNRGYGTGHNQALRRALDCGADFHLVVNSDVTFCPGMLSSAAAFMAADPTIGLLHPRMRYPSGEEQMTVRLVPSPADLIIHRFVPRSWARRRMDRYELRWHDRSMPIGRVAYVQGSFMLMSAEALRRAGLFDERYFMYPEDIDLSRRIASVPGLRAVYAPQFEAVHAHRAASRRSLRMLAVHAVNIIRYFNKWGWACDSDRRRLNSLTLAAL